MTSKEIDELMRRPNHKLDAETWLLLSSGWDSLADYEVSLTKRLELRKQASECRKHALRCRKLI